MEKQHFQLVKLVSYIQSGLSVSASDVINYTATGPGERALKLRLLQPLREAEDIEERLDCVTELINHIALTQDLHNLLSKTVDLDRVIPNIVKVTILTTATSFIANPTYSETDFCSV